MAAEAMNLLCHTAVGAGLIVPRASLIASATGAGTTITHQEETWNPDHAQGHPGLARAAAGAYTYTFAANYNDFDGNSTPITLVSARAKIVWGIAVGSFSAASVPQAISWIDPSASPPQVNIRTWLGTTLTDYPFWLEVM